MDKNLFEYIDKYAETIPNQVALCGDNITFTYSELKYCIHNNMIQLSNYGIQCGDCYILQMQQEVDFAIAILSLWAMRCWVIPIAFSLTKYELDKVNSLTHTKILKQSDFTFSKERSGCVDEKLSNIDCGQTGIYHMTSGTTGEPKLCIRTVNNLTREGISFQKTFQFKQGERIISTAPLYHSYALGAAFMLSLVTGSCLYSNQPFVPRKALKCVDKNKITNLILVPATARAIVDTYSKTIYDMSSIKVALVGAGEVTDELFEKFKSRFGIELMGNYGSTETGAVMSRLDAINYKSVGQPMEGVQVIIRDDEGNDLIGEGEGELFVKSQGMSSGYIGSEDMKLTKNSFYPMGDIVRRDKNGLYYISGRKKLMINVGGKKVNPYEIETVLIELDTVEDCVVIGVKNQFDEERVIAFVVGNQVSEQELKAHCGEKLSRYKIPAVIIFRDFLPKTDVGKTSRDPMKLLGKEQIAK